MKIQKTEPCTPLSQADEIVSRDPVESVLRHNAHVSAAEVSANIQYYDPMGPIDFTPASGDGICGGEGEF